MKIPFEFSTRIELNIVKEIKVDFHNIQTKLRTTVTESEGGAGLSFNELWDSPYLKTFLVIGWDESFLESISPTF
jgi:hypothetical protein